MFRFILYPNYFTSGIELINVMLYILWHNYPNCYDTNLSTLYRSYKKTDYL